MRRKARWAILDHNDEIAFTAEEIASEPIVAAGFMPAREWARRVAKENSDPEAPAPLRAIKVA